MSSNYFSEAFDEDSVKSFARYIKEHVQESFTGILGTGLSGSLMVVQLYRLLKVSPYIMRKDSENSHGGTLEPDYPYNQQRVLFIDDFVSSGATLKRVNNKLQELGGRNGGRAPLIIVAAAFYRKGHYSYSSPMLLQNKPTDISVMTQALQSANLKVPFYHENLRFTPKWD